MSEQFRGEIVERFELGGDLGHDDVQRVILERFAEQGLNTWRAARRTSDRAWLVSVTLDVDPVEETSGWDGLPQQATHRAPQREHYDHGGWPYRSEEST